MFTLEGSRIQATIDLNAPGWMAGDLMLRWSDNSSPLGYHPIPIISVKGARGPVVLITGGTHGDEFEGPSAIMRLAQKLEPEHLDGQVILLPALNGPAVAASSRVSPLDHVNLNRAFPGDANGGPTAMIADFVERCLLPHCDAAVDLHSGGKVSVFAACTLACQSADPALRARNIELAQAFGLPLVWELGANNDNRSLNSAADRVGVPMIATELGGSGGVDPAITNAAEKGLWNILRHVGAISGAVAPTETRNVEIFSAMHSIHAPSDGLFDRAISAGEEVQSGDLAGLFHHVFTPERPSDRLLFPNAGFVLAHGCRGYVKRGELLALVAQDVAQAS